MRIYDVGSHTEFFRLKYVSELQEDNNKERAIKEMTNNEVMARLETLMEEIEFDKSSKDVEALKLAISAIKKQMKLKPSNISEEYNGVYGDCPTCGRILYELDSVCKRCGQHINW